jgi:L-aminopeptidase/D-esterase-like protein
VPACLSAAEPSPIIAGSPVTRRPWSFVALSLALTTPMSWQRPAPEGTGTMAITEIPGVRVGHHTLSARPTGCTVVIVEGGAVGGVDVRGGAPGTRETDLLDPQNTVQQVHAVVLAGGSAFGLDAAGGVMRYLRERGVGFATSAGPVPIVPAAILFDLQVGGRPDIWPDAACGYAAASAATDGVVDEGSVGAGAGATVGKMAGSARAMKGGIGSIMLRTTDGLMVGAIVAVNASGSVIDPRTGRSIAGVRTPDGRGLEDPFALVRRGVAAALPAREHTTIGVVVTNARLTKAQARKVAEMAHAGLARTIVPTHTPADGDAIFALATGRLDREVNVGAVGALAAEAVSDAILRGVRAAKGLPGYPAAGEVR